MKNRLKAHQVLEKFVDLDAHLEAHVLTPETDRDEIIGKLAFAESLFPGSVVMLCNATHKNFSYVSRNFRRITGYEPAPFQTKQPLDYCTLIHPDDAAAVGACFEVMLQEATGKALQDMLDMRFLLQYRLRHGNGHYMYVEDEKLMLESRPGRHVGLTLLRDATARMGVGPVRLQVFRRSETGLVKIREYCPAQQAKVSGRESEVLALLHEGFSNQQIADRLSISVHTVKNHKKSLFRKTNVRNSLSLLRLVRDNINAS